MLKSICFQYVVYILFASPFSKVKFGIFPLFGKEGLGEIFVTLKIPPLLYI